MKEKGLYGNLLQTVKDYHSIGERFDGKVMPTLEELIRYVNSYYEPESSKAYALQLCLRYPELASLLMQGSNHYESTGVQGMEIVNDLDNISLFELWRKNKQIYRFDESFLRELANTTSLHLTKDLFDRVPYSCFYIDFTDCPDFVERMKTTGCVVRCQKTQRMSPEGIMEFYAVHTARLHTAGPEDELCVFTDVIFFPNRDMEEAVTDFVDTSSLLYEGDDMKPTVTQLSCDRGLYRTLLTQALTYLCSYEPDIRENAVTKNTYRKPTEGYIRDKFSEIHAQDVGVRFGEAFRVWTKRQTSDPGVIREAGYTGRKNRPHARRAHWHTYHVGTGRKETIVRWLHECFVNTDLGESDAIVHSVKKD